MGAEHGGDDFGIARGVAIDERDEHATEFRLVLRREHLLLVGLGFLHGEEDLALRRETAADLGGLLELAAGRRGAQVDDERAERARCEFLERGVEQAEILRAERADADVADAPVEHLAFEGAHLCVGGRGCL